MVCACRRLKSLAWLFLKAEAKSPAASCSTLLCLIQKAWQHPREGILVMNLAATHHTAHHPWTSSPIMHCTHTFPSTITPITQLSPFTHQPWLPHHTCTSFTHSHKSSTQTLTQCEVLFCPGYISERSSPYLLSLCVTPDCPTFDLWTCACDLDPLPGIVYVSALPLIFLFLPVDHCLSDSAPA